MELKQYLLPVLKWWWLVGLSVVVAAGFSYAASRQITPTYQTTTTLMVGQFIQNPNPNGADLYTTMQLAQSYVQIARREPVMQATVNALGLPMSWGQLAAQTSVGVIQGTQLIEIRVVDTNPKRATLLANEIARQLIAQSPTPSEKAQQEHRQFVDDQLKELESRINQAKIDIADLNRALAVENSARRIQDLQNQISTKQGQLNTWQANYASLLSFSSGGVNYLSVMDQAVTPTVPIAPRTEQNMLLASVVGLVLSVAAAFVLEYMDNTAKTPEDVQRITGLASLGSILRMPNRENTAPWLFAAMWPNDPISESYRILRTNLQFSGMKNPAGNLLVTSAVPNEGKTTTAANLAVILAQAHKQIILVDADLRHPSLHRVFGLSNKIGLTSMVLDENLSLTDVLQSTEVPGLRLLTSGPLPPNPSDVLSSAEVTRIIDRLRADADLVIFDSPPVLIASDATVLASKLMATMLIVSSGQTRMEQVTRSMDSLKKVNAKVIGVVMNKMHPKYATEQYKYSYYYPNRGRKSLLARWQKRAARKHEPVGPAASNLPN